MEKMSTKGLRDRLEAKVLEIVRTVRARTGATGRALRNLVAEAIARSVRLGRIMDELFARGRGKDVAKVLNFAFRGLEAA